MCEDVREEKIVIYQIYDEMREKNVIYSSIMDMSWDI